MKSTYLFYLLIGVLLMSSCEKYLDAKPDKALATPSTLKDLQAILDNNQMNTLYPISGDMMADDYYLEENIWNALPDLLARDTYIWANNTYHDFDWQNAYNVVFRANVALDEVEKIQVNSTNQSDAHLIKGTALFYRAFCFYHLLQIYTLPYEKSTATATLGIPLKLSSDLNEPINRATLAASYQRVIQDLETALTLLPKTRAFKTQPSKIAVFGQLARVNLVMGDYDKAGLYADSALMNYATLIDYNTISPTAANPFALFNAEVIFQSFNSGRGGTFLPTRARIDSTLYRSYATNDLRRTLFFNRNSNNSYAFKGDYSGRNSTNLFAGITTDELYLIKAEAEMRKQQLAEGLKTLNALLIKRWRTGTFIPYTASNSNEGLKLVLQERRKQLLFRSNSRWSDFRRLANDPALAVTLKRKLGNQTYELLPGDLRFANLIPQNTILLSGMQQNMR